MPDALLPQLSVSAVLREAGKNEITVCRTLAPIPGETVSFSLPHLAAHVEVCGYDYYHIKAELQSTRSGTLAYDGRTVRVAQGEPICALYCYPSDENATEEIALTLDVVRVRGGVKST